MQIKHSGRQLQKKATSNLVIRGTLILTITGLSTRAIGFYNRIFLSNLIGAKELGIYQLIFPLYMVAFSLTTFGNELALTKLVSEYKSRNNMKTANLFFRICLCINLTLGIITAVMMYLFADFLCARILKAPECVPCLRVICIGIPFLSVKGAIHGYFLGQEKSGVHGISDFLEQIAKVLGLYMLSTYYCQQKHYPASFAVWGIVIGEIISFLYSVIALLINKQKTKKEGIDASSHIFYRKAITIFFKNALPLTTNRLALTILQSIEAIIIPTVLQLYYRNSTISLSIYGVFTGMAFPFIMFPSTITNSLSTMLLPAVSSAKNAIQVPYLQNLCNKSLHFCTLIGLFSMNVFYIFGPRIGELIFHNQDAGQYLFLLSFLCPFIYLSTTLASILNGLGYATHNLVLTLLATLIRISFIIISIPKIGMIGYIIGLFVSYIFLTVVCLKKLQKTVEIEFPFLQSIFYPTVFFIFGGVISNFLYEKQIICIHTSPFLSLLLVLTLYATLSLLPFLIQLLKKQTHES
ncbi:MAG: polysaccharide biosynthesis protein [Eubacteriales bacterium]|nr:polysaccharide biosynthesis protein [Eubacteriales bacterium]